MAGKFDRGEPTVSQSEESEESEEDCRGEGIPSLDVSLRDIVLFVSPSLVTLGRCESIDLDRSPHALLSNVGTFSGFW